MNKKPYRDILDSAAADSLSRQSDLWPGISAQLERNSAMMSPRTRPLVAILIAILTLLVLSGVAYALGRALGYIPGIGLVDNSSGIRVLAEPISLTRDGVTLTISSVFVYGDRVELIYDVKGIAPENDGTQADDASTNPTAFCGGVNIGDAPNRDGDARLQLPDGTVLKRDNTGKYPQDRFAMKPVFAATIPASVTKMTLVLDCLPWARRGAVPENWSVPFELKSIPAGTVVGAPVIEVQATSAPVATETAVVTPASPEAASSPKVTFALERVAPTARGPVFYIRLHVENPDPAMVTVVPRDVYVIDSQGQKIQYINNSPYSDDPMAVWEYVPATKPAEGTLRLVLNDAVMKFVPLHETTFSFDVGENPQPGQTWTLDKGFDLAGYKVSVASVRAVTFADVEDNPDIWDPQGGPDHPEGSQGFDKGYQFTVRYGASVRALGVGMDILSDSCGGFSDVRPMAPSTVVYYTQLCRDGYPKGTVNVALRSLSVLVENVGQVSWTPDGTVAPVLPKPNVTLRLEKIVPLDSATVIYFSMDMENRNPSLVSIMPMTAYVIDSQGQKIQLRGNYVWQPFEHRAGSEFEFTTQSKPADGPLTVVVENAVAYYAPLYVDPPQATPAEMTFSFDVGENPQLGQTWSLNNVFEIAGYQLRVTSAQATSYDEVRSKTPGFDFSSQGYEYGYDFAVEADPSVKMQVMMDIISESPICWLNNYSSSAPESSSIHYVQLCRDEYPTGNVRVQLSELSVLVENTWQAVWQP